MIRRTDGGADRHDDTGAHRRSDGTADRRNDGTLDRRAAVAALLRDPGDLLVVTGLGAPSYDVSAAGDRPVVFIIVNELSTS